MIFVMCIAFAFCLKKFKRCFTHNACCFSLIPEKYAFSKNNVRCSFSLDGTLEDTSVKETSKTDFASLSNIAFVNLKSALPTNTLSMNMFTNFLLLSKLEIKHSE